jgi:iron complex outermembrane receptor protein
VEWAAAWEPVRWLRVDGNLTLSLNQIQDYTSYVAIDDYSGRTHAVSYGKTQMLMSPSVIGMGRLNLTPWAYSASAFLKTATLSLDGKYVGKQYIDNSMREEMAIPAYFVSSLSLSCRLNWSGMSLTLGAYVNNLFNRLYYAAGWRWEEYNEASGTITTGVGVYPQAPRNFCIKASLSF